MNKKHGQRIIVENIPIFNILDAEKTELEIMKNKILYITLLLITTSGVLAQNNIPGQLHGNFQVDMQTHTADSVIGAPEVPEKMLMNSYANLNYTLGNFQAGIRYEGYFNALQGFDKRYDGAGIPYRYVTYASEKLEITAGNFYDQFGSGLIYRAYEDKSLGIDNALDGIRIKYRPYRGIYIKGMAGRQRLYFYYGPGIVRGIDGEFMLNEIFKRYDTSKVRLALGGSFVSKYQQDLDPVYKLPENTGASAGRFNLLIDKFAISGEYAYKINDPSADNGYIYKPGNALLINTSYSRKGLGILLTVKRIDNMSFRSDRNASLNDLHINFIPPTTKTHTYSLLSMYPYATQINGEAGIQGEIFYRIKKKSKAGGKYGTLDSLNYSAVRSLKTTPRYDGTGYEPDFFAAGDELYFQDINIKINRKINKKLKLILAYMNLIYNYNVIRGVAGKDKVYADIGVLDATYKIKPLKAIRSEIQFLFTEQDIGSWASALLEYSIAPHWFFTVIDQYNYGNPEKEKKTHFFSVSTGYKNKANRIQIGYGRQREGIICIGGVCRQVPASNGFMVSVTSSF